MVVVKFLRQIVPAFTVLVIFLTSLAPSWAAQSFRVGIYPNPPMYDYDEAGRPLGLFGDVVEEIAKREGWSLEYVTGNLDESMQRLASGEIDLLPAIAYTPERAKHYQFNEETVFSNWGQILSRPGAKIQSILDLDGKTVAVLKGNVLYLGPDGLKSLAEKFSLRVQFIELTDFSEVVLAVQKGRADAGLVSRVFDSSKPSLGLEKPPIVLSPVAVRIAFAKTLDPAVPAVFDRHLQQLKADPQSLYFQSLVRWIGGAGGSGPVWLWPVVKGMGLFLALLLTVVVVSRIQVRRGVREVSRKNQLLKTEIAERQMVQHELARQTIFFEAAFNSIPDSLVLCNTERNIVRCNPAMTRTFGYSPQDLLGQKTSVFYASYEDYEQQGQLRYHMTAAQLSQPYVVNYRRKDGSTFPGETLGSVVQSEAGDVLGYLGIIRDISERYRAQEALQWELQVNRAIAELGRLILRSSSIEEISQVVLDEAKRITGSPYGFVGYIDPSTGAMVSPTMTKDVWEQCQVPNKQFVFHEFKGLWGWVLSHRQSILCNDPGTDHRSTGIPAGHVAIQRFLGSPALADGKLLGMIAMANADREYHEKDLQLLERLAAVFALAVQHKRAEDAVRESEERFRTIFEHAGAGMNTIDIAGRYLQVNPAFCRFVGFSEKELLQMTVDDLTHPEDLALTHEHFNDVREGRSRFFDYEKRFVHKNGNDVWGHVSSAWMLSSDGRPYYGVGMVQDVSESKLAKIRLQENEERFKYLAHHDSLTGLPNRLLFADRLHHAMSRARRSGLMLALLFFDLDRFKNINDSCGHEAGDLVLQAVAQRLLSLLRNADTVARFGGDEFIVLLEDVPDVQSVENFAGKVLKALSMPLAVGDRDFTLTSSIGISLYPRDGDSGEDLVRKADDAMFRAKERGRDLFLFFEENLEPLAGK